mmetsp:Transcript_65833/g.174567  ORF Transcript_65833/g.174567 Transcript_65833/m.174567 type:complete len:606 (-) Transcript_65833:162-1979(-)
MLHSKLQWSPVVCADCVQGLGSPLRQNHEKRSVGDVHGCNMDWHASRKVLNCQRRGVTVHELGDDPKRNPVLECDVQGSAENVLRDRPRAPLVLHRVENSVEEFFHVARHKDTLQSREACCATACSRLRPSAQQQTDNLDTIVRRHCSVDDRLTPSLRQHTIWTVVTIRTPRIGLLVLEELGNDIGITVAPEGDVQGKLFGDTARGRVFHGQRLGVTPHEQLQGLTIFVRLEGRVQRQPTRMIRHRHALRKHTQKHFEHRFRGGTIVDNLMYQCVARAHAHNGTINDAARRKAVDIAQILSFERQDLRLDARTSMFLDRLLRMDHKLVRLQVQQNGVVPRLKSNPEPDTVWRLGSRPLLVHRYLNLGVRRCDLRLHSHGRRTCVRCGAGRALLPLHQRIHDREGHRVSDGILHREDLVVAVTSHALQQRPRVGPYQQIQQSKWLGTLQGHVQRQLAVWVGYVGGERKHGQKCFHQFRTHLLVKHDVQRKSPFEPVARGSWVGLQCLQRCVNKRPILWKQEQQLSEWQLARVVFNAQRLWTQVDKALDECGRGTQDQSVLQRIDFLILHRAQRRCHLQEVPQHHRIVQVALETVHQETHPITVHDL